MKIYSFSNAEEREEKKRIALEIIKLIKDHHLTQREVKRILNIAYDRVKFLCNMVLHKFTPEILDEFLWKIKKEVNDE